ncbi:unnamed protein product [Periconia digitata]|uniref:Zn(2)-C6 fungal-type domain-containing protein n=1 Tax=Periconia digitata TaxID=1303443 RepID=A0A9W4UTZ4_9PLEO|nr:unnamed protein product [Periconia digitata]
MAEYHGQRLSDGTRSRSGCITCRIRKKKCDELRPGCFACWSRELPCYGFNVPAPTWFTSTTSWKEARGATEAVRLRTSAEARYRLVRRLGSGVGSVATTMASEVNTELNIRESHKPSTIPRTRVESTRFGMGNHAPDSFSLANIWQLRPETVWWDSKLRDLALHHSSSSNTEARLLMIFMEVIHPITHTFDPLASEKDKSWMLERLSSKRSLYCSALSISACFENSLSQPPSTDNIGISSTVRNLQCRAVNELQTQIDQLVLARNVAVEEFVWVGIQILDVIAHLETLEIFSMFQGHWEMHHHAARKVMDHIEMNAPTEHRNRGSGGMSVVGAAISSSLIDDTRRRCMTFSICNYIWVDVLATSTFGAASYDSCAFDYIPLLESRIIEPEKMMGCQGWILAIIAEIVKLEQWGLQDEHVNAREKNVRLIDESDRLRERLRKGIRELEEDHHLDGTSGAHEDIRLVSVVWAYGALVLLQITVDDMRFNQLNINQKFVDLCLLKLEELPTRLIMRTSWPYTIAGSMALSSGQHTRFRRIVGKVMEEAQPPGISWKGLMVMEECWRLRRHHIGKRMGWREAMKGLNGRVLLT